MTHPGPSSSKKSPATNKAWLVRGAVALVAGLTIGAVGGVVGVGRIEPGRPGQTDSLQLMLDSLKRAGMTSNPRDQRRAVDSADADQRAQQIADSTALANDPNSPMLPDVVNLEEGAARTAIETAGLTVGSVQFRASPAAAGVVLVTVPAGGRRVRVGTVVNLILSDGRKPPPDSVDAVNAARTSPRLP